MSNWNTVDIVIKDETQRQKEDKLVFHSYDNPEVREEIEARGHNADLTDLKAAIIHKMTDTLLAAFPISGTLEQDKRFSLPRFEVLQHLANGEIELRIKYPKKMQRMEWPSIREEQREVKTNEQL